MPSICPRIQGQTSRCRRLNIHYPNTAIRLFSHTSGDHGQTLFFSQLLSVAYALTQCIQCLYDLWPVNSYLKGLTQMVSPA